MRLETEELRQRILRMQDEQLRGMVTLHRAEYPQSELDLASRELARRGVSFDVPLLAPQPQSNLDSQPAWVTQATWMLNRPLAKLLISALVLVLSVYVGYTLEPPGQEGGLVSVAILDWVIYISWGFIGASSGVSLLLELIALLGKKRRGKPDSRRSLSGT